MIVKVCGITNLEDGALALEHGTNALGFNLWPSSPRYLSPALAAELVASLRQLYPASPFLAVAVLVGTDGWQEAGTDVLQFHGLCSPFKEETSRRHWYAATAENVHLFEGEEVIIDGSWGQGKLADWDRISRIQRPYILSGGLNPHNVAEAIRRLRPAGVDVCSGVEREPGRKDPAKLEHFLREVKRGIG